MLTQAATVATTTHDQRCANETSTHDRPHLPQIAAVSVDDTLPLASHIQRQHQQQFLLIATGPDHVRPRNLPFGQIVIPPMKSTNRPANGVVAKLHRSAPRQPIWHAVNRDHEGCQHGMQEQQYLSAHDCRSDRDHVTSQQSYEFSQSQVEQMTSPFSPLVRSQMASGTTSSDPDPEVKTEHAFFDQLTPGQYQAALAPPPPRFFNPVEPGPDCCTTPSESATPRGRESPAAWLQFDGPDDFEVVGGSGKEAHMHGCSDSSAIANRAFLECAGHWGISSGDVHAFKTEAADATWQLKNISLDTPLYSEGSDSTSTSPSSAGNPLSPVAEHCYRTMPTPTTVEDLGGSTHFFPQQRTEMGTPPMRCAGIRGVSAPLPKSVTELATALYRGDASPRHPSHAPPQRVPAMGSPSFGRRPPNRTSPSMGRRTSEMPHVVRRFLGQINNDNPEYREAATAGTERLEEQLKTMTALQVTKMIEMFALTQVDATTIKQYRRRLKNRVYTRVARSKARRLKKAHTM